MKRCSLFLVSFGAFFNILVPGAECGCLEFLCVGEDEEDLNEISFAAVTSYFLDIDSVYARMQINEPHLQADQTIIDAKIKHRICRSVASSGFMEMMNQDLSDMRTNYSSLVKYDYSPHKKGPDSWIEKIREDYEARNIFCKGYNYRTRSVEFSGKKEFAFACATKHRYTQKLILYFISDPYRLNLSPEEQTSVRFVCRVDNTRCDLVAMAEIPAITYASPEYPVEGIYLQMRKYYNRALYSGDDPVCGVNKPEKVRICASVMNTTRLVGLIRYLPDVGAIQPCRLQNVSFETDEANEAAGDEVFDEWMLPCLVEPIEMKRSFHLYFVSRAYNAHHAFVFSHHSPTKKWYIDNISGRIGAIEEDRNTAAVREDYNESGAPILSAMLRGHQRKEHQTSEVNVSQKFFRRRN